MPGKRKVEYTEELAAEILTRYSAGENIHIICKDQHMPCLATVWNWINKEHPSYIKSFSDAWVTARKNAAHANFYNASACLLEARKEITNLEPHVVSPYAMLTKAYADKCMRTASFLSRDYNDSYLAEKYKKENEQVEKVEVEI